MTEKSKAKKGAKKAAPESASPPSPERAAAVAVAPVASKGIPGLRLYSTVFPGFLAESGKPATLAGLVAGVEERVRASGDRGRAYVESGTLVSRARSFFREIANRARGVPSFVPFPVPGRSGGIVFGPRTATGEATIFYDPKAEKVSPAPVLGVAPAEPAKGKKAAK